MLIHYGLVTPDTTYTSINICSGTKLIPELILNIGEVVWQSAEGDFTGNVEDIYPW